MELISWTIYDLKVCHKIFIMPVVAKGNVSLQLQRQFLCMSSANMFTAYTCYSWTQWFGPIHHPNQLGDTGVDGVALGMGAVDRNGSRLRTLPPLYLLNDIYTVFYKGVSWGELLRCIMLRFRRHTELHYAALSFLEHSSDTNQDTTILMPFKGNLDNVYCCFGRSVCCCRKSLSVLSSANISHSDARHLFLLIFPISLFGSLFPNELF